MLNPNPLRQQINHELDRLPPESLSQILAFARALQPQPHDAHNCAHLWANWFAQVDALPLEPHYPTEPLNYTDALVEKYRAQGLNL